MKTIIETRYECSICGNTSKIKEEIKECERRHGRGVYFLQAEYDPYHTFPRIVWLKCDKPADFIKAATKKYILSTDEGDSE